MEIVDREFPPGLSWAWEEKTLTARTDDFVLAAEHYSNEKYVWSVTRGRRSFHGTACDISMAQRKAIRVYWGWLLLDKIDSPLMKWVVRDCDFLIEFGNETIEICVSIPMKFEVKLVKEPTHSIEDATKSAISILYEKTRGQLIKEIIGSDMPDDITVIVNGRRLTPYREYNTFSNGSIRFEEVLPVGSTLVIKHRRGEFTFEVPNKIKCASTRLFYGDLILRNYYTNQEMDIP